MIFFLSKKEIFNKEKNMITIYLVAILTILFIIKSFFTRITIMKLFIIYITAIKFPIFISLAKFIFT